MLLAGSHLLLRGSAPSLQNPVIRILIPNLKFGVTIQAHPPKKIPNYPPPRVSGANKDYMEHNKALSCYFFFGGGGAGGGVPFKLVNVLTFSPKPHVSSTPSRKP